MGLACTRCLDGRHVRCEKGDCTCVCRSEGMHRVRRSGVGPVITAESQLVRVQADPSTVAPVNARPQRRRRVREKRPPAYTPEQILHAAALRGAGKSWSEVQEIMGLDSYEGIRYQLQRNRPTISRGAAEAQLSRALGILTVESVGDPTVLREAERTLRQLWTFRVEGEKETSAA